MSGPIRFPLYMVFILVFILQSRSAGTESGWYERESAHFKVIYREPYSYLVPHILNSAENALKPLMKIFNYRPSEKIVIVALDLGDYGYAATTTVPRNEIRLQIEPFESGYENVPYNERFQWVLSHELVHIVVNDQASGVEKFFRALFGKVEPEQNQPLTIFYSMLTNFNRYTPRWHQEAIAVFMETWLSGGFGRILGNFDEMYFRSMVLDHQEFPTPLSLSAVYSQNSFLLESAYYLYGTRFIAHLAVKYGIDKTVSWFINYKGIAYPTIKEKFKDIFGVDFDDAWESFINDEVKFQKLNIAKLKSSSLTPVKKLEQTPQGWVTEPYYNKEGNTVLFGSDRPHHLACIRKLDLNSGKITTISTLPTPSLLKVASTAYDKKLGYFFYTTNNNQLYRDIWVLDEKTGDKKEIFKDSRVGDITVSSETHELWGVEHNDGKMNLVYSAYPYKKMERVTGFGVGDNIYDLSVSDNGKYLAAVLHRNDGRQSIILAYCDSLKEGQKFKFRNMYSKGSPEFPSWAPDNNTLYWNAYTNGVSNVYKTSVSGTYIYPVTNTIKGFFKPLYIKPDTLFAFEFTSNGFLPVLIPDGTARRLPAIDYYGQKIVDKDPEVKDWALKPAEDLSPKPVLSREESYTGFSDLKIQTFVPVVTGFQSEKVLGFYTHIADPMLFHDLTMEFGVSPFKNSGGLPRYHFKGKYEYKKKYEISVDYNAPDFYDLFNDRKRGMIGTKISLGNTHYWIYDNPLKVTQKTHFDYYSGIESINDNLIKVSQADFAVAQTNLNSRNLRRSIGSYDFESGDEFNLSLIVFGAKMNKLQSAQEIYGEWDNYSTWLVPHNVFHFKLSSGYDFSNDNLMQAFYYFGGFGNRAVDNVSVKQYRSVFRFPGIPIYSLRTDRFAKLLVENGLPPIRPADISIGEHYLSRADISFYAQGLLVNSDRYTKWADAGAQLDLVFKHWFNLESTLSAGIAKAWYGSESSWDWFLSFKLLRNLDD